MCFYNTNKNDNNAISFDELETKECVNDNQKSKNLKLKKNAKLMLVKAWINIGKRHSVPVYHH